MLYVMEGPGVTGGKNVMLPAVMTALPAVEVGDR